MAAAFAQPFRVATWHADLSRDGPGLLLRDIASLSDPSVETALQAIVDLDADVLLLTRFDHDLEGRALAAFADRLASLGADYPHRVSLAQNRGQATSRDLDGDGRTGGREDRHGYGRFAGAGSMAILSRHPVGETRDFSRFLWAELPDARIDSIPAAVRDVQRLSSSAHWDVPLLLPADRVVHLLAWAATPPIFGTGMRNRDRNHDEALFWLHLLDGRLPMPPPDAPVILVGLANVDPKVGAGDASAIEALAAHAALQSPAHGPSYALPEGGARLSVLMPSASLQVLGSGAWPADLPPRDALHRHRLIWLDLAFPREASTQGQPSVP